VSGRGPQATAQLPQGAGHAGTVWLYLLRPGVHHTDGRPADHLGAPGVDGLLSDRPRHVRLWPGAGTRGYRGRLCQLASPSHLEKARMYGASAVAKHARAGDADCGHIF